MSELNILTQDVLKEQCRIRTAADWPWLSRWPAQSRDRNEQARTLQSTLPKAAPLHSTTRAPTWQGSSQSWVCPWPSAPWLLHPQVYTPSSEMAAVWKRPAAMCRTFCVIDSRVRRRRQQRALDSRSPCSFEQEPKSTCANSVNLLQNTPPLSCCNSLSSLSLPPVHTLRGTRRGSSARISSSLIDDMRLSPELLLSSKCCFSAWSGTEHSHSVATSTPTLPVSSRASSACARGKPMSIMHIRNCWLARGTLFFARLLILRLQTRHDACIM